MTWGALIQGEQHVLSEPRSGGVLGLQFSKCDEQHLSCAPRFLDTMEAETGLPKIVTFCGHEVAIRLLWESRGWGASISPIQSIQMPPPQHRKNP